MKHSEIDERLIYEAKRAFDFIFVKIEDEFMLDPEKLYDIPTVPDSEKIAKQIAANFQIKKSKLEYANRLLTLFPELPKKVEKIMELKYLIETAQNSLITELGPLVDFNEKGPIHFLLGENYEKVNGPITHNMMISELGGGGTGTEFSSVAQMFFYYSRGRHPEPGQKTDGDLISLMGYEYSKNKSEIAVLNDLLDVAETIHEAEKRGISFEFDETLIFKSKLALEKITELKDGKALFKKSGFDGYYPAPNPVEVGEQIQMNLKIHKRPQDYIAELKDRFSNLKYLLRGLVEEKYLEEHLIQELDKVFWMVDRDTSQFGDSKNSYFGKKYFSIFQDEYDIVSTAASFFYHEKNIQPTREQIIPGDLIWKLNSAYGQYEENLRSALYFISLAETIQDTIQQAEETLQQPVVEESPQQPAAEAVEPDLSPIAFDKIAHRVVLLKELGIIDHLENLCKEKGATLTGREFGKLVGSILGIPEKFETIRKALSNYGQGDETDVKSEKTLGKVRSELLKYRIKNQ